MNQPRERLGQVRSNKVKYHLDLDKLETTTVCLKTNPLSLHG